MNIKLLIVGSKGMAGHVLYHYFQHKAGFEVVDIARDHQVFPSSYTLDVRDFSAVEQVIAKEQPHFVINCIGLLNAVAEENPDQAVLLNSYLPHFLARCCSAAGARLIHISTDCVFNGSKGGYVESDPKDGYGFYAQSKALGEVSYGTHLTIRTSIIGPELKENGIGLFHWFMKQKGAVKGYTKAYWSGVTTLELAKAIEWCIKEGTSGLCHLTNGEKISKHDLLLMFMRCFKKGDVAVDAYDGYSVDKSFRNTREDMNFPTASYEQMLEELRQWMEARPALYSQK